MGFVRADGSGESWLIRPAPDWTDWDMEAERLHKLSRTRLYNEGLSVRTVADRLIRLFAEDRVFASAPSWDGHWLSMLLRAAGEPRHRLRLEATETAFAEAIGLPPGPDRDRAIHEARQALVGPPLHRARPDAERERALWLRLGAPDP